MAAPTNRCPFKNNGATGITCEGTDCMAYDNTANVETCKILLNIQSQISKNVSSTTTLVSKINNS